MRAAFDACRKWAEPLAFAVRRYPSRPFCLAADLGDAGPTLRLLAHGHTIAERLLVRQHVVEIARIGVDHDRAGRLLAMESDDLLLILRRNAGPRVGRRGQELAVARRKVGVGHAL